jgi:hypothetical protein
VAWAGIVTVSDFKAAGAVDVGDKTFTFIDASPNILPTAISVSNVVPAIFTLTLGDGASNILGPGITGPGDLIYEVHINNPHMEFVLATLDTTFLGAKTEVDEFITPAGPVLELKSLNGSATLTLLDGQTIRVDDEISISPASAILSMQNSFFQENVPLPSNLAMASILFSIFGVAVVWRKLQSG